MKIKRFGNFSGLYGKPLNVAWLITHICNYSCSYCGAHSFRAKVKESDFSSKEELFNAIDNMAALNRTSYKLSFAGGEPTYHPYLADLLEYAAEKLGERLIKVIVISNGSKSVEYYKRLAAKCDLTLAISIHFEYAKWRHIEKIIRELSGISQLTIAVMQHPEYRDEVKTCCSRLEELKKTYPMRCYIEGLKSGEEATAEFDSRYTEEDHEYRKNQSIVFLQAGEEKEDQPGTFCEVLDGNEKKLHTDYATLWKYQPFETRNMYCPVGTSDLYIYQKGECAVQACTQPFHFFNIYKKEWIEKATTIYTSDSDDELQHPLFHLRQCPFQYCIVSLSSSPKFLHRVEGLKYMREWQKTQLCLLNAGKKQGGEEQWPGWFRKFEKEGSLFSDVFGFSMQETWGSWSEEQSAGFTVDALWDGPHALLLSMGCYKPNTLRVLVNGRELLQKEISGEQCLEVAIPADVTQNGNIQVELAFVHPLPSPSEDGVPDPRKLGVALRSVQLEKD